MPHRSIPAGSCVTAVAPAKINLHLAVGDVRADGYHDLVTVYQALDMWEKVTVRPADADVVTVAGPSAEQVPTDRTNLAARAVDLLREEAGMDLPLAIHIVKGVPVAGGMAGGSADAAAALVATDRLLGMGLSRRELEERAARLGSDIPFCVRGGTALGTGRGEALATLLHASTRRYVVVATARGGLATPAVYSELDRLRAEREMPRVGDAEGLVRALGDGDPATVAATMGNDLEAAALSLMPPLRKTLRAGMEAGDLHGIVSGSGPTCAFLCGDADTALAVSLELAGAGVCRTVRVASGPAGGAHVLPGRENNPQDEPEDLA